MCDGCGRGRNEFAGRVQNYRVRSSCHRNFLEIVKAGQDTQSCRIWLAGPEQDTIFYLRVTICTFQKATRRHGEFVLGPEFPSYRTETPEGRLYL